MYVDHVMFMFSEWLSLHKTEVCYWISKSISICDRHMFGTSTLFWPQKLPPFCRRHFDIHFRDRNVFLLTEISFRFVPNSLIDKMSVLVQVIAWRRTCDEPLHDDVIKWKHFPRYWPFVRGIHRSPVNSPYKGQWRGALIFSFICVWINGWVNNREAGDLTRYLAHYDVTVMVWNNEDPVHCRLNT